MLEIAGVGDVKLVPGSDIARVRGQSVMVFGTKNGSSAIASMSTFQMIICFLAENFSIASPWEHREERWAKDPD